MLDQRLPGPAPADGPGVARPEVDGAVEDRLRRPGGRRGGHDRPRRAVPVRSDRVGTGEAALVGRPDRPCLVRACRTDREQLLVEEQDVRRRHLAPPGTVPPLGEHDLAVVSARPLVRADSPRVGSGTAVHRGEDVGERELAGGRVHGRHDRPCRCGECRSSGGKRQRAEDPGDWKYTAIHRMPPGVHEARTGGLLTARAFRAREDSHPPTCLRPHGLRAGAGQGPPVLSSPTIPHGRKASIKPRLDVSGRPGVPDRPAGAVTRRLRASFSLERQAPDVLIEVAGGVAERVLTGAVSRPGSP